MRQVLLGWLGEVCLCRGHIAALPSVTQQQKTLANQAGMREHISYSAASHLTLSGTQFIIPDIGGCE